MPRDLTKEIEHILEFRPLANRNSLYQLKYFLINKEPTHQSRMWRCLRELQTRKAAMDSIALEMEELNDSNILLDIELERLTRKKAELAATPLDRSEIEVRIRQINRKKAAISQSEVDLRKRMIETEQEATLFLDVFKELDQVSPLKPYDSIDVQEEYWNERLSEELRLKMLLGKPIDTELAKTILSMRESAPIRNEMINIFGQIQSKIDNQKNEHDHLIKQAADAEQETYKTHQRSKNKEH